jgi:hypothetical protein
MKLFNQTKDRATVVLDSMGRNLAAWTPSEINHELDRLDKVSTRLTQKFIDAGRGHELPSETRHMSDPLANEANTLSGLRDALRREVERRYGPGAPSRLPGRQPRTFRAPPAPPSSADLIDAATAAVRVAPDGGAFKLGGRKYSFDVSRGVVRVYSGRGRLALTLYQ